MESISRCGNFPDENHQRQCHFMSTFFRNVAYRGFARNLSCHVRFFFFSTAGNIYLFSREKSFFFTLVFFARKGNTSEGKRLFSRGSSV